LQAATVVADGYVFDSEYQRTIQDAGLKLLLIDDYGHADACHAAIVLNQNICADAALYPRRGAETQLLLGSRYVLLRREFLNRRRPRRPASPLARRILVTLGGGDPQNITLDVVQALQRVAVPGVVVKVIVGPANPNWKALENATRNPPTSTTLTAAVDNMPELMAWADLAITAGGSTCWEAAFMGLPAVVFAVAENQRAVCQGLEHAGVVLNLGWHEQVGPARIAEAVRALLPASAKREEMSRRGERLVDGQGAERVLMHLCGQEMRLRRATAADRSQIWRWANDPSVRSASFSTDPIPWRRHEEWFDSRLKDPNCELFIAVDASDRPLGQVRFELADREAIVSVSVDRRHRKKGYGQRIIERACQRLFDKRKVTLIHAYLRPENRASRRLFDKAGFRPLEAAKIRGQAAHHMILRGPNK
jgi:UDP-2,4-diacetamido-2,4,6-trideoxy-beta-L-altropyranose hydrolase